jgi:hypothetical protein
MPQAALILGAARELIFNLVNWTQGRYAATAEGFELECLSHPDARSWCAAGALLYMSPDDPAYWECSKLLGDAAICLRGSNNFADLNDNCSHATVLRMFDLAIERVSK